MDVLGLVHTGFGIAALASGGAVAARRKGTNGHRVLGRCYVASMVGLNVTALLIYDLFGSFGPFHWFALASLATVVAGFITVHRRDPGGSWLAPHAHLMSWSYVGLLAAAVSEVVSRVPGWPFGWSVLVSSLAVLILGGMTIHRRLPIAVKTASTRTVA
jgi:uncharacterized membrane protein